MRSGFAALRASADTSHSYDQGVMSGLLTLDDFQRHFPIMTPLSGSNPVCWRDAPRNTIRDESMCVGVQIHRRLLLRCTRLGAFLVQF
jgi:hypothetical protein